ncbi:MAG TPA: CAP domain-containing protein [Acidimicrobiia bacterium]
MKRIALGMLLVGALCGAPSVVSASVGGIAGGGTAVVGATSTPDGQAGWTVTAGGSVRTTGTAHNYGDLSRVALHAPIVSIAAVPTGTGYWVLGADGGVFSFGSASFYGSTGNRHLNQPIVGMATTASGHGYWLVARDGGIFAFGDAKFYGSTGGIHLNQQIVGMTTRPSVKGYWLVASDGGIFSFGAARFEGSTGALHLVQPVRAMAATHTGRGYWLVASDGGIFSFGDAPFYGSTAGSCVGVVGIIPTTKGYIIAGADGSLRQMSADTAQAAAMPSSCPTSSCPASYAEQVVAGVNAQRAAAGLPGLHAQSQLMWAANRRSVIQAASNSMNHDGWDSVVRASGYPAGWWGENVAFGYTSPTAVMSGWMGSPDHRANILSPHYTDIGVGCAYSRGHVAYWTQDFGSPS